MAYKNRTIIENKSLAAKFPELAKEWHPVKNSGLTPYDVSYSSGKKVWWYLPYDDPTTGDHFEFEWQAYICNRTKGIGCPFISKPARAVWPGFNDLATKYPEIAAQWHPEKNGTILPNQVLPGSEEQVWWYLPYDDSETGKHFNFEWKASIVSRTHMNAGCPFLSNQAVWPGFNDLATKFPDIAAQWHPTKNGTLTPSDVTPGAKNIVVWLLPHDDIETGKHFDFEWKARVYSRTSGNQGCPYLSGKTVWRGFNDLETKYPEIAKEWHPTKNGRLKPYDITYGSGKKVWWYLPYDDPETGKHFEFEWPATVASRTYKDAGCPYLNNKAVWPGYNDLETRFPNLAREWHPTKNGNLTPNNVTWGADITVWWLLPYEDPKTGKQLKFEWRTKLYSRTSQDVGCPYLKNKAIWMGFNDLATTHPELAAQWHPIRNGDLTPQKVTCGYRKRVWWLLPYDDPETGKHFDFEWPATVASRTSQDIGCPYLTSKAVWPGYNDFETYCIENHKEYLLDEWDYDENHKLPNEICVMHNTKVHWRLSYDNPKTGRHHVFTWKESPAMRVYKGYDCPYLSENSPQVWFGFNDLKTHCEDNHLEYLLDEWDYEKNWRFTPETIRYRSGKKVWWRCSNGHEWKDNPNNRTRKGSHCKECMRRGLL